MKLLLHEISVPLLKPFKISRGTVNEQTILIVELQKDGQSGFGEVGENGYYGHSLETMTESILRVTSRVESTCLSSGDAVWEAVNEQLSSDRFALSALDMAAQDLFAKLHGRPCYQEWGLQWTSLPESSFTISIGTPEEMVLQLKEQPGWRIYKIKLGVPDDIEIVRALRLHTDAVLRVDANCAWTVQEAITKSIVLKDLGVEFIEQPLPRESTKEEQELVYRESALPIIADESCCLPRDVERCAGAFHGINVKLCKCGGPTPALAMLKQARSLGLHTMIGCMLETSIGISAAAQLLPLLDYADLDGAILLGNDPAEGVTIDRGVVSLANRPGCGGRLKQ
ncbi:dipeptide epimerase [Bythopirellula goksoeyrii]|uniref:Dipeptide epimerase n=1 Tax=Bythopirellula goksoeyrii TaxID=1400387 RepID=A0A5B9QIF7_9BACT|nr:dipeptide epimerase [Bythopirellula goksoeyrii]QEG33923.1 L-Ala-D/L-Glu epimerase [Bythopirellula goksoeyrii]